MNGILIPLAQALQAGVASEDDARYRDDLGPSGCANGECLADCISNDGSRGACVQGSCEVGVPTMCGDTPCRALRGG